MTTLPISDIVRINTIISPRRRPTTSRKTLLLTRDMTLDAGGSGKIRSFANFSELAQIFGSTSAPYRAGQIFFGQVPFPRELVIGRWAENAADHEIRGGAPAPVADISGTAITDGSLAVGGEDITNIGITLNATYAQIAAAVQTAVAAVFTGATCTYNATNGNFVLAFPPATTGINDVATDAATGTPLATLLGLSSAGGGTLHTGSAAESISEALDRCKRLDDAIYFLGLEAALNDTASMVAASTWAQANRVFLSLESQEDPEAVAAVAVNREALVAVEPRRTLMTNSAVADYKSLSAVGRMSSVNYAAPRSVATLKFKVLPNTNPDEYDRDQVRALQEKHINFYVRYGGEPTYAEGEMMNGDWADEIAWQDWFSTALELAGFNILRSVPKIPLTSAGIAQLRDALEGPCRQGVTNGGLAPNQVSDELASIIRDVTGDQNFDGFLSTGYLIWVPPIATVTQAQRDNRTLPDFSVFGKGAGAVHGLASDFYFER